MSLEKDGGPAFPGAYTDHLEGVGEVRREQYHGMSLRDWFAGRALTGMCTDNPEDSDLSTWNYPEIAKSAYAMADAMLTARQKDLS